MERLNSLDFHYNDLIQKHKLCLECMNKQKEDYETMKKQNQKLMVIFSTFSSLN
jgi:hypothetical protein